MSFGIQFHRSKSTNKILWSFWQRRRLYDTLVWIEFPFPGSVSYSDEDLSIYGAELISLRYNLNHSTINHLHDIKYQWQNQVNAMFFFILSSYALYSCSFYSLIVSFSRNVNNFSSKYTVWMKQKLYWCNLHIIDPTTELFMWKHIYHHYRRRSCLCFRIKIFSNTLTIPFYLICICVYCNTFIVV